MCIRDSEYIEHAIKRIITDLTIMSALKNNFSKEKSVLVAKPTACEDISASIKKLSHLIVSSICLTLKIVYFLIKVSSK